MRSNRVSKARRREIRRGFGKIMKCLCSGEQQLRAEDRMENTAASDSLGINENGSESLSRASEATKKHDTGNIEEAELSLRESGSLNYEEARALLGRYEYQKGNIEAALHVFEGIDISTVAPKIKSTLARGSERRRRSSQNLATPAMSIRAASLLLEAFYIKSKSLQALGRFKEAAQCCKAVLNVVESSLPDGLPVTFGAECKLHETLSKSVELLPELWKLADSPNEAILSYRQALLHPWNLDNETTARIQKQFAVFLLYVGGEANPPNLRSQMDTSFVPRNNLEEAILLLIILLRKFSLGRIEWDQSVLDHLSFALSVSGDTVSLAKQLEELLPGSTDRKERYYTLALCYHAAGEDAVALNLLKKLLGRGEDPNDAPGLLLAAKICGENPDLAEEGIGFSRRALESLDSQCDFLEGRADCLLGVSLLERSKSAVTDSERQLRQSEALEALESASRITKDPSVLYHLALAYAEQRKLDTALKNAKALVRLEGGCNVKGWLLLARVLSAKRCYVDAEAVVDVALDQTGKWDQGELLRTKAKLQIAQGELKSAVGTYTRLLAIVQVRNKSIGPERKSHKSDQRHSRSLELEIWHDLAYMYIGLAQWLDAEICLSKSKSICSYSAVRWHATGVLFEAKGLYKEALKAFLGALDTDPTHVPSLISTAVILRLLGNQSESIVRSFLMEALRLDRVNHTAWYNLGLFYEAKGSDSSALEAVECFEAAVFLEESAPVEPFR